MIDVAFLGTDVRPAATAVVIDVLRATSTITLALASGYERVLVAGSIDEADGAARRPSARWPARSAARGRPASTSATRPRRRASRAAPELVLATTNGAPAIVAAAAAADEVLVASLLNLDAVAARSSPAARTSCSSARAPTAA